MRTLTILLLAALTSLTGYAQTAPVSTTEAVQFKTSDITLDGTLSLPAHISGKVPVVLLIAGSGATDRNGNGPGNKGLFTNTYQMLADSLNRQGIAVLRYDKRLIGRSVPADIAAFNANFKAKDLTFERYIQDAEGFINQLQTDKRFSDVFVAGHSEGSLVGMVAAQHTNAAGFISLAGAGRNISDVLREQFKTAVPDELRPKANDLLDSLRGGKQVSNVPFLLMSLFHPNNQPFLISWMKYDPAVEIQKLKCPVMIVQGGTDFQVPVSEAEALKKTAPSATFLLLDSMNHILKNAPANRAENAKTYSQPDLPLTPGLVAGLVSFVKKSR